jgi:hypothetical protein
MIVKHTLHTPKLHNLVEIVRRIAAEVRVRRIAAEVWVRMVLGSILRAKRTS